MTLSKALATSGRILKQLSHDFRTIVLMLILPAVLIIVLKYVFQNQPAVFGRIAPMLLGIFPLIMMFLITSIVTLRERRSGTLDRLMSMPISKLEFIFGYAIAFSFLGFVQALISSGVTLGLLQVTVMGGTLLTLLAAVLAAFLGTSLGLFTSAFATSEFQAIQFLPAFIFPQLLMCGLFVARNDMAKTLQWLSAVMPLTYSVDAMKQVALYSNWTANFTTDLAVVLLFATAALILGTITIRRQQ